MSKAFLLKVIIVGSLLIGANKCKSQELRFPHHYSEFQVSMIDGDAMGFGANYAFVPGRIGGYGSFIIGDGWSANVGPIIRLTNSSSTSVDIHIFQGIGMINNHLSGETGIRFGFGRDRKFALWSLSGSLTYSNHGLVGTVGLSWPITGIAAASGLVIAYAVVVGSAGGSIPDFSSSNDSKSKPTQATSSNSSSSNGTSCSTYQKRYEEQLSVVKKNYEAYANHLNDFGNFNASFRKCTHMDTL